MSEGPLSWIEAGQHRIEISLEDTWPIHSALYQAGPKARKLKKDEIAEMLDLEVIEPAQNKWTSPIVFALKKDGTLWFCVDYRKLNSVIVRDFYPILCMDECVDLLGVMKIF